MSSGLSRHVSKDQTLKEFSRSVAKLLSQDIPFYHSRSCWVLRSLKKKIPNLNNVKSFIRNYGCGGSFKGLSLTQPSVGDGR